jgi:hypothetical protein
MSALDRQCHETAQSAFHIAVMAEYYVSRPQRRRITQHYRASAAEVRKLANSIIALRTAELAEREVASNL